MERKYEWLDRKKRKNLSMSSIQRHMGSLEDKFQKVMNETYMSKIVQLDTLFNLLSRGQLMIYYSNIV